MDLGVLTQQMTGDVPGMDECGDENARNIHDEGAGGAAKLTNKSARPPR